MHGTLLFASYRRNDSTFVTERICDRLVARYGRRRVILDVDSIPPGVNFRDYIEGVIPCCKAVLAIIGPGWHLDPASDGRRYFDDPQDLVGFELGVALRNKVPVIPVLVGGATPPAAETLPQELRAIAKLHAVEIRRNPDFHRDVDRMISVL